MPWPNTESAIAQCLDYNLVTQTRRLEEIPYALERQLAVQIHASLARGIEPFSDFSPAPRRYWEMYERARARLEPIAGQPVTVGPLLTTETRLAA